MTEFSQNEKEFLEKYKLKVEGKLNWGESANWRHHDFETLSEKIYEETGVMLSSTTLKRIWGKLKYNSVPNSNTLNALASFIGYENWLEFRVAATVHQENGQSKNSVENTVVLEGNSSSEKTYGWKKWLLIGLSIFLFGAFVVGFILHKNENSISAKDLSEVSFTSEPVTDGVPNTVVFKYDVSHLPDASVSIQQSWDERLQFDVSPVRHEATSIYYYPGYFRAKLLVNGQVAKEHDLYIKSDGWLATLNTLPKPRYFLKEELKDGEQLGVYDEILMEAQNKVTESPAVLGFHYVDDFGDLYSDNFTLESSFRNTYTEGDGICQLSRVVILCTEGAMIIPFSIPGCVGNLRLIFNDVLQEGKKHDLSSFGCNFSDWQNMKLEVQNRHAFIYLNGHLIHELVYQEDAGKIAGLRFLFTGSGEVDRVRLSGEKGEVYFEEDF